MSYENKDSLAKEVKDLPWHKRTFAIAEDYFQKFLLTRAGNKQLGCTYWGSLVDLFTFGLSDCSLYYRKIKAFSRPVVDDSKSKRSAASCKSCPNRLKIPTPISSHQVLSSKEVTPNSITIDIEFSLWLDTFIG